MITPEELQRMKETDIREVSREELTNLCDITIDMTLNPQERVRQFAEQTNNLYIHKMGEYVVKVSYADTDQNVNDVLERYMANVAEIIFRIRWKSREGCGNLKEDQVKENF